MSLSPARRNHNDPDRDAASWSPLERAERLIDGGLHDVTVGWLKVGVGLQAVRAGGLYAATHSTFDEYCRERWGLERTRAFRQIRAAAMSQRGVRIRNPDQADAVAPMSSDDARAEAITRAEMATNSSVTAKALKAAVAEMTPDAERPEPPAPGRRRQGARRPREVDRPCS